MTTMDDLPKFKASDGREIALLPGWFQNKVNIGWPHGIKEIRDISGRVLYRRAGSGPGMVVAPEHVDALNAMLAGNAQGDLS
ncbi:MAG: hypothetical protein IIB38_14705 [Candidatus Hydrogenedentes bacterium]|nr:hypothetical protein [Candidatus Hydrogenedentota bacterium]